MFRVCGRAMSAVAWPASFFPHVLAGALSPLLVFFSLPFFFFFFSVDVASVLRYDGNKQGEARCFFFPRLLLLVRYSR